MMIHKNKLELSIFDIFKIGIGPSSSHTMGPWVAARDFLELLRHKKILGQVLSIQVELTGSLAKTGRGHATDMGVVLGLMDELPESIEPETISNKLSQIKESKTLKLVQNDQTYSVSFDPRKDIVFNYRETLPYHPNGLIFKAQLKKKVGRKSNLFAQTYYSIGGGFIEKEEKTKSKSSSKSSLQNQVPYPITQGADLLEWIKKTDGRIDEVVLANEKSWRSEKEVDSFIDLIKNTMLESIYEGCHTEGILPGGLKVRRRAYDIHKKLIKKRKISFKDAFPILDRNKKTKKEKTIHRWLKKIADNRKFVNVIDWVICFALAVNETNAASGRIVTAPTNGAAGVIPAVLTYYLYLQGGKKPFHKLRTFFLTASIIGILFKKNATISAAAGGCQAEIGVSSAMAAGALTAVNGGNAKRILMAAEIAMEHHLGMTCDPIGGLVQIPCIERNSMGSIKAITASQIALSSDPDKAIVHLDQIIKTMWETAQDMSHKYKETSEGGLAKNVKNDISVNHPEC